ncbi:PAS domain S-box protein [Flavobacterium sp. ZB4P13]|uniref:PAS domain-containing hybrid sensor histidine kinase/response regulator n=1 Tax=Flavobacterium sp. ZB4P13 TaxID=3401728 RepID=UPI003AAF40EB
MGFHKLLQKQIKKHLTLEFAENNEFESFFKAINDSYLTFERDRNLMNHAFQESEKEYREVNQDLKSVDELKTHSIKNLYESLQEDEENYDTFNEEEKNNPLFISKYISEQIRKRKETENRLSRTVELLKTLLANLPAGILMEDENRKLLFTNQSFCDVFSIPMLPETMIGVDCTNSEEQYKNLFKEPEAFSSRINAILARREIVTHELLETIDGRFLERDYIPISIGNESEGHLWRYVDVTQRIQTRNLLEQSEKRSRLIMDASLNAIITIDSNGIITFWNGPAETIFGWEKDEVLGKVLSEIIIPHQYAEAHNRGMKHYMKTGDGPVLNRHFEITGLNRNGNEFPIEISIIPIKQNGETFFCSFIQDISERKKAEENLKYQEEKYRNIIANMNLGLVEVDNNDIIQFANQSFLSISGFEMDELLGESTTELFVSEENLEMMKSKKEMRENGVSDIYQICVKNKSGESRWWAIGGAPEYDDKGKLIGSIGIHLDVTEQKQLEIDLEKEKIKAQEASKAKEVFLANMSHEIRTPLNAIIGFLRELEKQELPELQKKYIENSSIASKHLLAIINNILDISKIEAGEMSLDYEDFVFENAITNVISVLQSKAEQKGLNLTANISKAIHQVLNGDALRLEQILFNLVGNALKFTQKGEVAVNCELISDTDISQEVSISISDTGIGMDKKFVDTIFNKFSQEDKAITRRYGGTGLGMAIAKEFVQLMKGRVDVESEKNKGTTIRINLSFNKGNEKNINKIHVDKESIRIDNISILLVEDNDLNRMVAQNSLQYFNCKVTEAENGLEALEILRRQDFDVILMDIQMPEMDGIEATKIIRNEFKLATPIIALTANVFKPEIEKCNEAGMDDYIAKPFDEKVMIETIAKHVRNNTASLSVNAKEIAITNKLYNLNSVYNLSKGDVKFIDSMMLIFVEQTAVMLEKIKQKITNDNFMEVGQLIHEIKPSIEIFGIISIIDDVKALEKMVRETQDKEQMLALFESINIVLKKAVAQIQENELCR